VKERVKFEFTETMPNRGIEYPAGAGVRHAEVILHDFRSASDFCSDQVSTAIFRQQLVYGILNRHAILCVNGLAFRVRVTDG
jgi:hypothetical protein